MKKSFAVSFGVVMFIISSLLILSCDNGNGPADANTPLNADPSVLTVSTGSTGYITVSGGVSPYSIQTAPNASIATATITNIGVVTILPVDSGKTAINVQDHSDPVRSVNIPITVIIGHGGLEFNWTVNGQAPIGMCGQVNSTQVRVTVNGYPPVLSPCGTSSLLIDSIVSGNHTVTAELLSPSLAVLATITQPIIVPADKDTGMTVNFVAPLIIGTLHASWTINGQPAGSGCQNATTVRIAFGRFTPIMDLCSSGQLTMTNIPAGTDTLIADLFDDNNTRLSEVIQNNVTINVNQITQVNIAFTNGPIVGTAQINWSINGGQNCIPNGNIVITANGPSPGNYSTACGNYSYTIQNLSPGTYSFDIALIDPAHTGQQATASIQNVNIANHENTAVAVDIPCLFCGGTSSTGFLKVNVKCGGTSCPATGTLYVIVKDCGANSNLSSDNVPAVTISGGSAVSHTVNDVPAGGRCVKVFLDVDGNGVISTGDLVTSIPDQNVIIYGGQTTTLDVMLDTVSPKIEPGK